MKGKFVIVVILALMIVFGIASAKNAPDEYGLSFYTGIVEDLDIIQVYDASEITAEILESRSADGKIIIERVIGTVIDDDGNGEVMNPENPDYDYISYRYTNGAQKGDVIMSYMIYNPDTDYVDDIMERFDYIIDRLE